VSLTQLHVQLKDFEGERATLSESDNQQAYEKEAKAVKKYGENIKRNRNEK
jgi:hypothetical protein